MPSSDRRLLRRGAGKPHADLEANDKCCHGFGRRGADAFGERQQRRNDWRCRLTEQRGEIVVHDVGGDTIRERGKLRRGTQRLADDRDLRACALGANHVADEGRAMLAAAREHHGERIDEGKPGPCEAERRHCRRIKPDHEVCNDVAELARVSVACLRRWRSRFRLCR